MEKNIEYKGFDVTIKDDKDFFNINFNTGAGEAMYDKQDWTLEQALEDQFHLDEE